MTPLTLGHYLLVSGLLFLIGLFGALTRRSLIGMLMGIELMFNAANLNLAAFDRFLYPGAVHGQAFAVFNMAVAAAEVVVGLALIVAICRRAETVCAEDMDLLKG